MPTKKPALPSRLSEYLLQKAEPFEFYPKRIYGLAPEVREIFRDLSRALVEWRKTFQPKSDGRDCDFHGQPVMLDQFYSRELLAAVPGFVERTRDLRTLTFEARRARLPLAGHPTHNSERETLRLGRLGANRGVMADARLADLGR
jgi:hypothetical protein